MHLEREGGDRFGGVEVAGQAGSQGSGSVDDSGPLGRHQGQVVFQPKHPGGSGTTKRAWLCHVGVDL